MKAFLDEDFLLDTETARRLYHEHAKDQPIYDYHCHLSPAEVAGDRRFDNLTQIWLEGDHYKWRGMRSAGIDERFITGDASEYEKYLAWAKTVPMALGNPLYHWTHLELRRPFGITNTLFGPNTAKAIWDQCGELLSTPEFSARGIMRQMNVAMVGTTDDPIDSLEHHQAIAADDSFDIQVCPSWRPDKAFKIELAGFGDYINKLAQAADVNIDSFASLLDALEKRLQHFAACGCQAADHGVEVMRFAPVPAEKVLDGILAKGRSGAALSEEEIAQYATAVQVWLGKRYAKLGWVMQMHLGAQRNNNSRMFRILGPDSGFDSIGDTCYALPLARMLDAMDCTNELPRTILYCLNPRDNEMIATMIGNFQGGGIAGKVQFGSGWWFNDQRDGIERQIEQLSQLGLLSQFVGMLTDSRSFLSYTRHEYFRRILCNMVGDWVEKGQMPNDMSLLGPMIENICFGNAKRYFSERN